MRKQCAWKTQNKWKKNWLKNENMKKQNETLKAWNGTETGSFWRNQFDYGFQLFLELGLVLVPISIFLNDRTNGMIPTEFQ